MEFIFVLVMALVQGVAEFLPISSSGHLAVLGHYFGFDPDANLALGVVLHAGTLCSIVVFYFQRLLKFLTPERFPLALRVIAASVPAGIVGVGMKLGGVAEEVFSNLIVTGIGFLVTATLLLISEKRRNADESDENAPELEKISFRQAMIVGLAQAVAVLPGISRSGSTIAAGLFAKLRKKDCAEFSFLLAIPAIGGAAFLEFISLLKHDASPDRLPYWLLAAGFTVSAAVGYFSLKLLVKLLERGKLAIFSYYLYIVGALVLLLQFTSLKG